MSRLLAIVPTLGVSPWLADALTALRAQGEPDLSIAVVWQGAGPARVPAGLADRLHEPGRNLGFAGAVNLALATDPAPLVALVNDDVLLAPGWLAALAAALAPGVGAVQGVNLELAREDRIDGWGLAWNRWWQAVQLGHGEPAAGAPHESCDLFGVSATAALYRREALDAARLRPAEWLDGALFAYYEDVDLACRLRARGFAARLAPAARARHAGSATGARRQALRRRWIHAHRLAVLARLLGRSFWVRLPWLAARDLADALRLAAAGDLAGTAAVMAGWGRAAALLPRFARRGPPLVPLAELARFRVGSPGWPSRS
ncbi:MAG: glycosyltransferase [Thermoanaerobaculia bacterium]|nr:glycosyltransferase [Thermoanaerobaculia bacterium]